MTGKFLKEFNTLCSAAKLPKAHQGVPLKVISEIVGHSDIGLTQNLYQHVYGEAGIDAAEKMDEVLTRAPAENPVATRTAPEHPN